MVDGDGEKGVAEWEEVEEELKGLGWGELFRSETPENFVVSLLFWGSPFSRTKCPFKFSDAIAPEKQNQYIISKKNQQPTTNY